MQSPPRRSERSGGEYDHREAERAEGDGEVISLAHELLEMEQSYEQTLKNYLR